MKKNEILTLIPYKINIMFGENKIRETKNESFKKLILIIQYIYSVFYKRFINIKKIKYLTLIKKF